MSDRKRAVEEDTADDEVIGPLPVTEQPIKKKQKGLSSCNEDARYLEILFCVNFQYCSLKKCT